MIVHPDERVEQWIEAQVFAPPKDAAQVKAERGKGRPPLPPPAMVGRKLILDTVSTDLTRGLSFR